MRTFTVAVDPGSNGGIAWEDGTQTRAEPLPDTPGEIYALLRSIRESADGGNGVVLYLENVVGNAGGCRTAQQGFGFGRGYGQIEAFCLALGISRRDVTPRKWQNALGIGARGEMTTPAWKAYLKERAQRIYPQGVKVTNATADALLLLFYARAKEPNPQ